MRRSLPLLLLLMLGAAWAEAQTPVYWKRDHIHDAGGRTVATATPQPSDTQAPNVPGSVQITGWTANSVSISWAGVSDNGSSGLAGYAIYRGAIPVGAVGSSATTFTDIGLVANTAYTYKVAAFDHVFNYSSLSSAASTTTAAPVNLAATGVSGSQVDLSWTAPPSAPDHYGIWRKSGGGWSKIATASGTSASDTGLGTSTGYFYKVSAEDGSNAVLGWTNADAAVTMTFTDDPLTVGSTAIKAAHLAELRTAVNAVRAAAGLSGAGWTDSSPAGVAVKAVHFAELRIRLSEALGAAGLIFPGYTDPALTGIAIKKVHIEELRQRVQ